MGKNIDKLSRLGEKLRFLGVSDSVPCCDDAGNDYLNLWFDEDGEIWVEINVESNDTFRVKQLCDTRPDQPKTGINVKLVRLSILMLTV